MVQEWKDLIPIFRSLRNPDMKERHWIKIQTEIGHDLQKAGALTIGNLLEMHIGEAKDIISAVTAEASNEATLEAMLRKVQEKWVTTEFIVNPYKDTKVHRPNAPMPSSVLLHSGEFSVSQGLRDFTTSCRTHTFWAL